MKVAILAAQFRNKIPDPVSDYPDPSFQKKKIPDQKRNSPLRSTVRDLVSDYPDPSLQTKTPNPNRISIK